MELLINDFPVSIELGSEENISDVVNSISEWTRERNLIFYELSIDDDMYQLDDIPDMNIEKVDVINCFVRSKADIVFTSVEEGVRYCDRVSGFIKEKIEGKGVILSDMSDLSLGIDWLREVLIKVEGLLGIDVSTMKYKDRNVSDYLSDMEKFRIEVLNLESEDDIVSFLEEKMELFPALKDIFGMLLMSSEMRQIIVSSIDSPDALIKSLSYIKQDIPDQLQNIEETAIAFQTGKDAEGSERLNRFVDFMYTLTRTLFQLGPVFDIELTDVEVDGVSLEDKNEELKQLLGDTITVMENNDIISLADILEYEIKPALENMNEYIDVLQKVISGE